MLGSCKKKDVEPEETPVGTPASTTTTGGSTTGGGTTGGSQATLQNLFNTLSGPTQHFTMNAASSANYTCANGTQVFISPNSFLTASGGPVTGMINIELKDVLSKKDMILNNAFPVSNGQLLVSGGEVFLKASQGGQSLKINPNGQVIYQVPAGNSPSYQMLPFYAPPVASASVSLAWALPTGSVTPLAVVQDTSGTGGGSGYYYYFPTDSVNWTNCDYYYNNSGAKTTCTVTVSGNANNSNTMVFLSMNGTSSIARLSSTSYFTISQQFASYANSIPVGASYTIGAISYDGTNYYYGSQQVVMTTDMTITLPPLTQRTKAQIEASLTTLQ